MLESEYIIFKNSRDCAKPMHLGKRKSNHARGLCYICFNPLCLLDATASPHHSFDPATPCFPHPHPPPHP